MLYPTYRLLSAFVDVCIVVLQVKPGMPYLDVIRRLKESSHLPISAYHVSGEYAMMKAAVERGWLDERAAVLEVILFAAEHESTVAYVFNVF